MEHLKTQGFSASMYYIPDHLCQMHRPCVSGLLPVAEKMQRQLVTLSLSQV